jgi:hypothetical protein
MIIHIAKPKGSLALFCLFIFVFLVLTAWCFVALIQAKGHRSPYAFLFSALILSFIGNAINIAVQVRSITWKLLSAVQWLVLNWAYLCLYLSIAAVLWNRETAIHAVTAGKAGRRTYAVTAVYAVLVVIIFVLGTAGPAISLHTISIHPNFRPGRYSPNMSAFLGTYSSGSAVVLTGVIVVVSTILLWRASRAEGIVDKVLSPCT